MEFNEKLQELRKSKTLTQKQLAEQLYDQGQPFQNGNPAEALQVSIR
ncbi:MAG: hypothetical protein RR998_07965 [Oscillospiraceae bacterium]